MADDEPMYTSGIPVVNGASPVPEGPGLGIAVDEAELRCATMPGRHRVLKPLTHPFARLTLRLRLISHWTHFL